MKEKTHLIMSIVIMITISGSLFAGVLHKNAVYKEIQKEITAENWSSAKNKLESLGNYKDCEILLKDVNYHYYINLGDKNFEQKDYKSALNLYNKAIAIKKDNIIEQKVISTEVLVHKQQLEDVKIKAEKEEQKRKEIAKQKIDKSAINPIPTVYGKGYDKTIKRYGVANIKKNKYTYAKSG